MPITRNLPGLAAIALALSGCVRFGAEPPKALMTLTPEQPPAVGRTSSVGQGEAVTVLVPSVPATLATTRVPVQTGPTAVAYVKDAQWAETPNRLFQRLLSETFAARGRAVLPPRQANFDPGVLVGGQLLNFGIDEASRSAVVTFEAAITRGGQLQTRRFEARLPVTEIAAETVGPVLNRAANQVAGEVAEWVGS